MNNTKKFTQKEQLAILKRLLTYLKPKKLLAITACTLLLITVIGDVLGPFIIKIFIDDHLTPMEFETNAIIALAAAFIFIQVMNVVLTYVHTLQFNILALNIIQQLRIDVFEKIHQLGMRYFDDTPAGSIVSRATNDTEVIKDMFVRVLISFVQTFFLITAIYIAMFFMNPQLALVTLFVLPLVIWVVHTYRKHSAVVYMTMREKLSELNARLSESLSGMSMIQAFRQEDRINEEFAVTNEEHYQSMLRNTKLNSLLLRPAIDLIYFASIIVILGYFGITSFETAVEIGVVYAFITYISRFFEPINQVMESLAIFQQA
ncbi:MAG: ABC transporter ATP-binding protein, partial [Lysinibacillus sp.]